MGFLQFEFCCVGGEPFHSESSRRMMAILARRSRRELEISPLAKAAISLPLLSASAIGRQMARTSVTNASSSTITGPSIDPISSL